MTRNEEGGCRPLFQGINNVLKNEPKLRPCPFCDMPVRFVWSRLQCASGHRFYPNDPHWPRPEVAERWNSPDGIHDFCGDIHGFRDYNEFCEAWGSVEQRGRKHED